MRGCGTSGSRETARIQVLTVQDLLDGKKALIPHLSANVTVKRAKAI